MKCFYDPRDTGDDETTLDGDPESRPWGLPVEMLDRHGACELKPDEVPNAAGWPTPAATVYRKSTLLLPADLHEEPALSAINEVLGQIGMQLLSVPPMADAGSGALSGLLRTAVLVPASSAAQPGSAAESQVDAWRALTALRSATASPGATASADAADSAGAPEKPVLDAQDISRVSLEHLLFGAAITGAPAVYGLGVEAVTGAPAVYGLGVDPAVFKSYVYAGGSRTPVEVALDAPARKPDSVCVPEYGRRPVIAVLDTGVRAHPWLDVTALGRDKYATEDDGFVQVDQEIQDAIYAHDEQAAAAGDRHRRLIRDPWDAPATLDPLTGELAPYIGHGTFIAGIYRQIVPDATVLSIRIMHSDGIVYEGDLLVALSLLAARVAEAQQDNSTAHMIDAVSLSLGYFIESADDATYTVALRQAIDALLGMGVVITAAAGNCATSRKFYPAALAAQPSGTDTVPLVSVGALNPNGTRAVFSDDGSWVTSWASGAALTSTFPVDINGSLQPDIEVPGTSRASLDPDDYDGGFAIWSGTSFSAPALAAQLIREMVDVLKQPSPDPALRLDVPGAGAATARVLRALQQLRRAG
jgi:Subtilase family